ncbi:MAG: 50S ribosomal protein L29 [Candidatus Diapherotrites archaeon]|uniref:Large ribosomal subunit protein uL29 n=1 Tax=Candidatus Iainarchaeum sp. TaxID=3101447 RepID=A0A938YW19_9ARCH|nr:50S ribosomal protein L29 [Candidatus Diapherotrites archaeon]
MKIREMRSLNMQDATEQVMQLRGELAKERALVAGGTRPENPGKIRKVRKDIARLLTVINEKGRKGEKMPEAKMEKAVQEKGFGKIRGKEAAEKGKSGEVNKIGEEGKQGKAKKKHSAKKAFKKGPGKKQGRKKER